MKKRNKNINVQDEEFDNKAYWKQVGGSYKQNYPAGMYKEIDKAFVNTMVSELDLNKVQSVLEVGCGFGRVAKLLMPFLPNLQHYHALDISEEMVKQANEYCEDYKMKGLFIALELDFETRPITAMYDLVLSVEVMTSIPNSILGEQRVKNFIDKMLTKSKKYVVNQDWFNAPNRIEEMQKPMKPINEINHFHDYDRYYSNHRKVLQVIGHSIPRYSEHIFCVRVK